mgnify:CR=1 FL=1
MTKICLISDTHTKHDSITIPECDLLIHAGDATYRGEADELYDFAKWLNKQPADFIVDMMKCRGEDKNSPLKKLRILRGCHFQKRP